MFHVVDILLADVSVELAPPLGAQRIVKNQKDEPERDKVLNHGFPTLWEQIAVFCCGPWNVQLCGSENPKDFESNMEEFLSVVIDVCCPGGECGTLRLVVIIVCVQHSVKMMLLNTCPPLLLTAILSTSEGCAMGVRQALLRGLTPQERCRSRRIPAPKAVLA
eukprot:1374101-Amphidinium_carterae.1